MHDLDNKRTELTHQLSQQSYLHYHINPYYQWTTTTNIHCEAKKLHPCSFCNKSSRGPACQFL